MLDIVKLALRITTDAFDDELAMLIVACINEMTGLGILTHGEGAGYYIEDPEHGSGFLFTEEDLLVKIKLPADQDNFPAQIKNAVVSYCKWNFGNNPDKDDFRAIYDRQIAQLKTMTGFTNWRP